MPKTNKKTNTKRNISKVLKANVFADKAKLTDEQWRELRREGIGGSDASAIVGMNPYVSPFSLYMDKVGLLPEKEDNEAMRQGRDLEEYVASRFREVMEQRGTPKKTKQCGYMLQHPEYPWMLANVDRLIVGENAGLECKTTSVMNLKKFKNGEFPEQYYVQCVHYLAVTGADRWYLAVLILNQGFKYFVIERDENEIAALIEEEKAFWEKVQNETPPSADGMDATSNALDDIYTGADDSDGMAVSITQGSIVENLLALEVEKKALEKEIEKCKNIIKAEMGDAVYGGYSNYKISWTPQSKKTFDVSAFIADHPSLLIDKYYKTSNFRKFTIKEIKI